MATSSQPPRSNANRIGLTVLDYRGAKTTLCAGCGHNAISERIIDAFFEMGVAPERVIKLSGIGCSSKSPAYFMGRSHSFNAVHGRMPSVATGAALANHRLLALGVSGDGDTASIGIGQFVHLMRRNLPMIYIIENNGVYGLTKGQFSATADVGSKLKTGVANSGSREAPGVYVSGAKLASIGLRIRRGASYHGLALNVSLDLEPFERINVCGYPGLAVTRLLDLVGGVDVGSAAAGLVPHLVRLLGDHSAISTDLQAVSSR